MLKISVKYQPMQHWGMKIDLDICHSPNMGTIWERIWNTICCLLYLTKYFIYHKITIFSIMDSRFLYKRNVPEITWTLLSKSSVIENDSRTRLKATLLTVMCKLSVTKNINRHKAIVNKMKITSTSFACLMIFMEPPLPTVSRENLLDQLDPDRRILVWLNTNMR